MTSDHPANKDFNKYMQEKNQKGEIDKMKGKTRMNFSLENETIKNLRELAKQNKRTMSATIEVAIAKYAEKEEVGKKK